MNSRNFHCGKLTNQPKNDDRNTGQMKKGGRVYYSFNLLTTDCDRPWLYLKFYNFPYFDCYFINSEMGEVKAAEKCAIGLDPLCGYLGI